MNVRSELLHALHPQKSRLFWISLYVGILLLIITAALIYANTIRTHILPQGSIALTTNYSKYIVGEPITYTLTNNYNSSIYFTNQCPAEPLAVYKKAATGWVRIHKNADIKVCILEKQQTTVPPLSTATGQLTPWQSMFAQPGTYRLVAVVDSSVSFPYVDFDVMNLPAAIIHQVFTSTPLATSTGKISLPVQQPQNSATSQNSQNIASGPTSSNTTSSTPATPPAPVRTAKTYTLTVNSSGNYSPTYLNLFTGDSIQYVYAAPRQNEVRTSFAAQSPTTTSLSSVTLDQEFTSRTIMYSSAGKWIFKADDYSGNTGTLVIQ